MGAPLLVGIDKGTTVTKTAVFELDGTEVVTAHRRVPTLHAHPGLHEEEPEKTWELVADTIRECMAALGSRVIDVRALGVVGHMGGAWFLDREGRSIRKSIAWPDARANPDVEALENGPDHDEYLRLTETSALPGMTLTLLGHLVRSEPELVERTDLVLRATDYIQYKLTGVAVADVSNATFEPVNVDTLRRDSRILEILGAEAWESKLPELVPSGQVIGGVLAEVAEQTGLPAGTPVIAGLGDVSAGMIGCGAVERGTGVSILGTSWLSVNIVGDPHSGKRGIGWMYAMPNHTFAYTVAHTAGAVTMDWWLSKLAPETLSGSKQAFANIEAEVLAVPEGTTDLTFLPYFAPVGIQAPVKVPQARGTLLGLQSSVGRGELLRSIYEGMIYAMADCYQAFAEQPDVVRLTGGGAQSNIWPGVLSNTLNLPVERVAVKESAALGVAVLAGVAVGLYSGLEDGVAQTVRTSERYEPQAQMHARHLEQRERFALAREMSVNWYTETAKLRASSHPKL